jgi:HlyD family secretion protein
MTYERKLVDRRLLWLGAVVVLIVVFFTVRSFTRERLPVRVARAEHQPLNSTVSTNGRVEPVVKYDLYSPVSTTVKAVYVQPGDKVQAGKLLMVLDDIEARAKVASAASGVKASQAALDAATHNGSQQERQMTEADIARERLERDQAQSDLGALTKLNSAGAASQSEVAAAHQRLETAEGALHASETSAKSRYSSVEVGRAEAALADAEANLTAAKQVLAQTKLYAPIAGTVYKVEAGRTEFIEAGKLLIEMADLRYERVRAYFDEPEIGRLAVGQQIQIKWDAKPGLEWKGEIERTPITVITVGTRNVGEVLVKVDDENSGLLPDTNVTVTVTTSSEANALAIPREALHTENGRPYVYKVEGNYLRKTWVTRGNLNLTQVAILSGLEDGESVAVGTTNGQPLQEGVLIKVMQ